MLIAFDLDGTLVDSSRDLAEAASELVQSHGGPPLSVADVVPMVGDGAPLLVRRALAHAGLDQDTPGALAAFLDIYDRRLLDHTVAYDGMREALALVIRHGPLAVLTNKPLAPSRAVLRALGLEGFFVEVIGGDNPYGRKPKPEALLHLARAWGDGRAVLVGDSPADAKTSSAAGCPFVFARYGFGAGKFGDAPPPASCVVDHPRELPAAIGAVSS